MPDPFKLSQIPQPKPTLLDRVFRYVLYPLIFAIGLHGLVNYAFKGNASVRPEVVTMP